MSKEIKPPDIHPGRSGTGGCWFRGDTLNLRANTSELKKKNAEDKYILHGWLPKTPFIERQSRVTGIGSCFARNVSQYLYEQGYRMHIPTAGVEFQKAGSNHTFAMRQLFEWAWLGKEPSTETWYNGIAERLNRGEDVRAEVSKFFSETEVFILTLGLSEVWYDKDTNDVFWRAIPVNEYNKRKHGFRVSTVEENKDNVNTILDLIKEYAPQAKVILTVSPVPLKATFRPVSQMTANTVSKSILRVTVDEIMRERGGNDLYYWPSFEIAKEFLPIVDKYPFDDGCHVNKSAVNRIMKLFDKHYLVRE